MKIPLSAYKQKLKSRKFILALVLTIVLVGGGLFVYSTYIKDKPVPPVAKKQGPGLFTGPDIQVTQKMNTLEVLLTNYHTNNNQHYPAELSPDVLSKQPGIAGDFASVFVPPAGIKFVYSALPKGCTTAGNTCTGFTLEATDDKGKVVHKIASAN